MHMYFYALNSCMQIFAVVNPLDAWNRIGAPMTHSILSVCQLGEQARHPWVQAATDLDEGWRWRWSYRVTWPVRSCFLAFLTLTIEDDKKVTPHIEPFRLSPTSWHSVDQELGKKGVVSPLYSVPILLQERFHIFLFWVTSVVQLFLAVLILIIDSSSCLTCSTLRPLSCKRSAPLSSPIV